MVNRLRIYILSIACLMSVLILIGMDISFNPQDTVFFFDLHDVVLKRDTTERFKLTLVNPLDSLGVMLTPVSRKGCANGEEYALRLKKRGHTNQAAFVRKFSGAYKVNSDVFDIILALKAKGYRVCMASNIGVNNLNDLLSPTHPQNGKKASSAITIRTVLESFDELIFVDYESDTVIAKPDRRYFEMLQEQCGYGTQIIFVDDNKTNVAVADECGLLGIRFTSAKQLLKDFKNIGVL